MKLTKLGIQALTGNAGAKIEFNHAESASDGANGDMTSAIIQANPINSWGGILTFATKAANGNNTTEPAERMRIDSSGNLLVNTTSTSVVENGGFAVKPDVGNGTRLDISNAGEAMIVGRTGSNGQAILFYRGGTNVGSISLNSSTTAYNTSSDYRLKENIVDLTGASARVNQLNPSRF